MDYRLLALDMDGTVLTSEKVISPKTEGAIHEALDAGKDVFFATGRAPIEMKEHLKHFPEMRYVMYLSGAIVRDLRTGKDLHNVNIPLHIVEKIMDIGRNKDALVAVYAGDGLFVDKRCRGRMKEFGCECFEPLYEQCAEWVDDIRETALAHGHEVHKINFYCGSEAEWLRCAAELKELPVSRASGIPNNEEISPLGVDKGTALRAMCEALGGSGGAVHRCGRSEQRPHHDPRRGSGSRHGQRHGGSESCCGHRHRRLRPRRRGAGDRTIPSPWEKVPRRGG